MFADRFFALGACSALLCGCQFSGLDFSPVANGGSEAAYFAADQAPSSGERSAGDIIRSPDGLFYTDALVNGVRVRFVVDSGSSLVVFSRHDADRAGVALAPRHDVHVRTASGVARMRGVTVQNLHIDGRSLDQVDAVIADDISGASLLGQSALSRLEAVTFSGDRLQLR